MTFEMKRGREASRTEIQQITQENTEARQTLMVTQAVQMFSLLSVSDPTRCTETVRPQSLFKQKSSKDLESSSVAAVSSGTRLINEQLIFSRRSNVFLFERL